MSDRSPQMLKATLIGGCTAGVVSVIPIVGALNLCCCALVVGGGLLAAYVYSRDCVKAGAEFRPASGARVGLVAGGFFAVTYTAIATVFVTARGMEIEDYLEEFEQQPGMTPEGVEAIDAIRTFLEPFTMTTLLVSLFFIMVLIGAVFCTVGGLIGGAAFRVEAPPASTPGGWSAPTGGPGADG